tara:strand:- start:3115 stop:3480 length:366 start_codon:yes stop_codon:yes gene_type:complete
MKIVIQGTRNFKDYEIFLTGMRYVIERREPTDTQLTFYAAGPANINAMLLGFINITENTMKSNGVRAKIVRLPHSEIQKKLPEVDKFLFFCLPKEPGTNLVKYFQDKDPEKSSDFVTNWRF